MSDDALLAAVMRRLIADNGIIHYDTADRLGPGFLLIDGGTETSPEEDAAIQRAGGEPT